VDALCWRSVVDVNVKFVLKGNQRGTRKALREARNLRTERAVVFLVNARPRRNEVSRRGLIFVQKSSPESRASDPGGQTISEAGEARNAQIRFGVT
jgi:hypothetical protein